MPARGKQVTKGVIPTRGDRRERMETGGNGLSETWWSNASHGQETGDSSEKGRGIIDQ